MYFQDGRRIDLTLVDCTHLGRVLADPEPRRILLDKDRITGLDDVPAGQFGRTAPPTAREFADTCNEFWWGSLSTAKGLGRGEVLSAKTLMESYQLDMLLQVLAWKAGRVHGFPLACGKFFKYLSRLLNPADRQRLMQVLSPTSETGQWGQLLAMCDLFAEAAGEVAAAFGLPHDPAQGEAVRRELERLRG